MQLKLVGRCSCAIEAGRQVQPCRCGLGSQHACVRCLAMRESVGLAWMKCGRWHRRSQPPWIHASLVRLFILSNNLGKGGGALAPPPPPPHPHSHTHTPIPRTKPQQRPPRTKSPGTVSTSLPYPHLWPAQGVVLAILVSSGAITDGSWTTNEQQGVAAGIQVRRAYSVSSALSQLPAAVWCAPPLGPRWAAGSGGRLVGAMTGHDTCRGLDGP